MDMTELNGYTFFDAEFVIGHRGNTVPERSGVALSFRGRPHYRALTDEKIKQARLRDRLATADLRLSVQLDTTTTTGCDAVQTTTRTGSVVHGAHRAQLDRAHAQRIIGITGDGDQGLIALQACQAYAKEVSDTK